MKSIHDVPRSWLRLIMATMPILNPFSWALRVQMDALERDAVGHLVENLGDLYLPEGLPGR